MFSSDLIKHSNITLKYNKRLEMYKGTLEYLRWSSLWHNLMMIMTMMMMMMNCFCRMVVRRKVCILICSRDQCQRFSLWQMTDILGARFEPAQNMSSGFTEWSIVVVITTKPLKGFQSLMSQRIPPQMLWEF